MQGAKKLGPAHGLVTTAPTEAILGSYGHVSPRRSGTAATNDELKAMFRAEAERAVRSATEEMSVFSAAIEDRKKELGERTESAVVHLAAQYDARLSALKLQHAADLDKIRRATDESTREHQLVVLQMQQQFDNTTHVNDARHRQEITSITARFEQQLQHALTQQHEEYATAITSLADNHRNSVDEVEAKWLAKLDGQAAEHAQQLLAIKSENDLRMKQLEGTHTSEYKAFQEKELRSRSEQAQEEAEKLHAAETRALQMQMQIVDLTSKLDTAVAQLRGSEGQAEQTKERMENNLRSLMACIEEERTGRQKAEVAMNQALQETSARAAEAAQRHNEEILQVTAHHQQQVQLLQEELNKVAEAEKKRQSESLAYNRQLEKEVSEFQQKLQEQLRDQLQQINLKHSHQLAVLKQEAAEKSEGTAQAFSEKVRSIELDSSQQLASLESEYASKVKALETQVGALQQDLKAQKELADFELHAQTKALTEKHAVALKTMEQDCASSLQALRMESETELKKQERELTLQLEKERLDIVTQCREVTLELQERDRSFAQRLEEEVRTLAAEKKAVEERRISDLKLAERVQEQLRAESQQQMQEITARHIDHLRNVEAENARLRADVEKRLQAASEKYNKQLSGMNSENKRLHDTAEQRIKENTQSCSEQIMKMERAFGGASAEVRQQLEKTKLESEHNKVQAEQLLAKNRELEMELATLRVEMDKVEMQRNEMMSDNHKLHLEKGAMVRDKQFQKQAAESERASVVSKTQLDSEERLREASKQIKQLEAKLQQQAQQLEVTLQGVEQQHEQAEAERQAYVKSLEEQLAQAKSRSPANPDSVSTLQDRHTLQPTDKSDPNSDAVRKIFDAEQKHLHEKKKLHDKFKTQLAEAEVVAQKKMSDVGEKFTGQMVQLQHVVTSLQQRLLEKDNQSRRIEQELQRAHRAITEITVIYQAREKEFIQEMHKSQLAQIGLNDGIKQVQLEKQLQRSHDEQKLLALEGQVQQALQAMQCAVSETMSTTNAKELELANVHGLQKQLLASQQSQADLVNALGATQAALAQAQPQPQPQHPQPPTPQKTQATFSQPLPANGFDASLNLLGANAVSPLRSPNVLTGSTLGQANNNLIPDTLQKPPSLQPPTFQPPAFQPPALQPSPLQNTTAASPPIPEIQAQHALSQKLANQQAASLKQQLNLSGSALGKAPPLVLGGGQGLFASPPVTISNEQLAAL